MESIEEGDFFSRTPHLCLSQPMLAFEGASHTFLLHVIFSADVYFLEFFPADFDMLAADDHPHRHGGMILLLHALEFHAVLKLYILPLHGLGIFRFSNVLNLHHILLFAFRLSGAAGRDLD
jgi:hypothetical protein